MDDQTKTIVASYRTALESFKSSLGDEAVSGLAAAFEELAALAEKSPDINSFSQNAAKADLFGRLTNLMQEISSKLASGKVKAKVPVMEDIRKQYRLLLKEAETKKELPGYAKVVKEHVLASEKASSPAGFALMCEKQGLTLGMATAPLIDQFSRILRLADPNETVRTDHYRRMIKEYGLVSSADELAYMADLLTGMFKKENSKQEFIDYALLLLVNRALSYYLNVGNARRGLYKLMPDIIGSIVILIYEIRSIVKTLEDDFGIKMKDVRKRILKRAMNQGSLLPETDRAFLSLDPKNLDWLEEVLNEEILSGMPVEDILLRRHKLCFNPGPDPKKDDVSIENEKKGKDLATKKLKDIISGSFTV